MSDTDNMESGYRIKNLLLLESNFKRINNVNFDDALPGLKMDMNINTEVGVQGNVISVAETVTVVQNYNDAEQFSFLVKMVGVFECVGESELKDYDLFGRVNGAAIIFPYIREHISGLSLKAGLGPIILPPVNVVGNQKK